MMLAGILLLGAALSLALAWIRDVDQRCRALEVWQRAHADMHTLQRASREVRR